MINLLRYLLICLCPLWLMAASRFELVKLADGVYATVRTEPPGFGVESNSVFIINEQDVVVVDAQSNLAATREVVRALRSLTDKPVRYVVNTHWHDDHIVGNQVYREAYPGVSFIGHTKARDYLQDAGLRARERFHRDDVPQFAAMLRKALADGKSLAGKPLTDEERQSYQSDLVLAEGYATVPPDFRPPLPDLTVDNSLTLWRGERSIEIRYLGRGHTSGDLVVYLPSEGIVCAGDLIVWPIPLIGGDQSHVADWSATLGRLAALKPSLIVPGHGPLLRDDRYLLQMQNLMRVVTERTHSAMAGGTTLEQVQKTVKLDDLRRSFAGDSPVRNLLFSSYVAGPAVTSAYHDLQGG
ncbi:MBL fold metallo-hydrolase [Chitinimonas sp.]|uniref:MBL fold metallo-hydrolase n=1 Tax=Chitinimonas sp. TaxID=1934313 RepID=UPI002F94C18B